MESSRTYKEQLHLFQSKLFLEGMSGDTHYRVLGKKGNLGRRYTVGPLCVEYYTGDVEPELSFFRGFRFVIWNRVRRTDVPGGWIALSGESDHTISAYIDIQNIKQYYTSLSDTFKTYYNRYNKQTRYVVHEVSCDLYAKNYKEYAKEEITVIKNIEQAKRLHTLDNNATHFYFLEDKENNTTVAGIAVVDCLDVSQTFYLSAFTRKDKAPKEAGFWLCNYWMKESYLRNIPYANVGIIWSKGQPESWKGFSNFKMKFNPALIILLRELIRFTFSLHL